MFNIRRPLLKGLLLTDTINTKFGHIIYAETKFENYGLTVYYLPNKINSNF